MGHRLRPLRVGALHHSQFMTSFHYKSGDLVCQGDVVLVKDKRAVVESILGRGTRDAKRFSCSKTGGVLLKFEDGDVQLWPWINEDLELVAHSGAFSSKTNPDAPPFR